MKQTAKQIMNILLVEDNPMDARLAQEILKRSQLYQCKTTLVDSMAGAQKQLAKKLPDTILLDLGLPDSKGMATYFKIRDVAPRVPVVILSASGDQDSALAAIQVGAKDYLIKSAESYQYLDRAIRYAVEAGRVEKIVFEGTEKFQEVSKAAVGLGDVGLDEDIHAIIAKSMRSLSNAMITHISIVKENKLLSIQHVDGLPGILKKASSLLGVPLEGVEFEMDDDIFTDLLSGKSHITDNLSKAIIVSFLSPGKLSKIQKLLGIGKTLFLPLRYGNTLVGICSVVFGKKAGPNENLLKFLSVFTNAAAIALHQYQTQQQLAESESKYRDVVEHANDGIVVFQNGIVIYANARAAEIRGISLEEAIGSPFTDGVAPEYHSLVSDYYSAMVDSGEVPDMFEIEIVTSGGQHTTVDVNMSFIEHEGRPASMAILRDITERKRAEMDISELAKFPNENPQPILRAEKDGAILYANQAAVSLLNNGESMEGQRLPEGWQSLTQHAFDSGVNRIEELKYGDYTLAVSFIPISNRGYVNVYIDNITERRQAEETLRRKNAAQRLLQIVAVAANEAIDVEQALASVIKGVCAFAGWPIGHVYLPANDSSGQLRPTTIWQLQHPERFESFKRVTERTNFDPGVGLPGRVFSTRKPAWIIDVTKDTNFPRAKLATDIGVKAGFGFPVLVGNEVVAVLEFFSPEAVEPDLGLLEIMADVGTQLGRVFERQTYRSSLEQKVDKRTEELSISLADTEVARSRLDGILKSIGDGLIVTDLDNRVVLMNRAVEEMLGVRLSEVLGQPIELAIKEESLRERIVATLKKRMTGHAFDFELPDAESEYPRIMRARTSVILNKENQQSGIITIIHDVTHEREVDRMKTEFISTAAHELRTPLTSIQGFSEILMTRDDLDEAEREKFLGHINRQAGNLAAIINDLLDISRIESGRGFALDLEACDAGEAIQSILKTYLSNPKNHSFKVSLPKKSQQLIVDKEKMAQALENLVSNAVKYSPAGAEIKVSGEVRKGWYDIIIEDEGIGMTAEQLGHIYDKFYRADSSNTAVEGTGLGMSIVKAILDAHGGKIDIMSKVGVGTKVTVSLPIPVEGPGGDEITSERVGNGKLDAV